VDKGPKKGKRLKGKRLIGKILIQVRNKTEQGLQGRRAGNRFKNIY
jgi:hypothetical protein